MSAGPAPARQRRVRDTAAVGVYWRPAVVGVAALVFLGLLRAGLLRPGGSDVRQAWPVAAAAGLLVVVSAALIAAIVLARRRQRRAVQVGQEPAGGAVGG